MPKSVKLTGSYQRSFAKQLVDEAPDNYIVRFSAETRRDAQNRKLWPMLSDIQKQAPGMVEFSTDDIKLRFLNCLGVEMRFLPTLEGQGVFPIGLKSSTLTVDQFSGLIELLYKYGAENGVRWSEPQLERRVA